MVIKVLKCKLMLLSFLAINLVLLIIVYEMAQNLTEKSSCIFCNIVNKLENTVIIYEDDELCVFNDIKPASEFHILVIPKRHIEDAKALVSTDKELVTRMIKIAEEQLEKNNFTLRNARLGFHWPPFRSVKHLHLHVIAPETNMRWLSRLIFMKGSYWFVSPEYVLSRL